MKPLILLSILVLAACSSKTPVKRQLARCEADAVHMANGSGSESVDEASVRSCMAAKGYAPAPGVAGCHDASGRPLSGIGLNVWCYRRLAGRDLN